MGNIPAIVVLLFLQTLHNTMCEDTVFWDLNYAMQYKDMGTAEIRAKALKVRKKQFKLALN